MSRIAEAYQCGQCDEWHDDYDVARECCEPDVYEGFKCLQCGDCHSLRADAENCCADKTKCPFCQAEYELDGSEPEACCGLSLYTPTQAELEAAGQTRLFL